MSPAPTFARHGQSSSADPPLPDSSLNPTKSHCHTQTHRTYFLWNNSVKPWNANSSIWVNIRRYDFKDQVLASNGYYSRWRLDWHLRFVFGARISPSLTANSNEWVRRENRCLVVSWPELLNWGCWSNRIYLWYLRLILDFFCGSGIVVGRDQRRWWLCGVSGYLFILGNLFLIKKKADLIK